MLARFMDPYIKIRQGCHKVWLIFTEISDSQWIIIYRFLDVQPRLHTNFALILITIFQPDHVFMVPYV